MQSANGLKYTAMSSVVITCTVER